jgi:hypothetical protein
VSRKTSDPVAYRPSRVGFVTSHIAECCRSSTGHCTFIRRDRIRWIVRAEFQWSNVAFRRCRPGRWGQKTLLDPAGCLVSAQCWLAAACSLQERLGSASAWVDEILHTAKLSPFKRGSDLDDDEAAALREAMIARLGGAIDHYERTLALPIPDKLPIPLTVHRRNGEPCPRCWEQIEAVCYADCVMCYCPGPRPRGRSSGTAGSADSSSSRCGGTGLFTQKRCDGWIGGRLSVHPSRSAGGMAPNPGQP